jgi:hypothetical protein
MERLEMLGGEKFIYKAGVEPDISGSIGLGIIPPGIT